MATEKKYKFPKALGSCADKLYELREKRLAMQKEVDAVEAEEKALKEHIINTLPKSEASGISGKVANVKVVTKEVPNLEDQEQFFKYLKKTGDFDLIQRRLNAAAVQARWEAGKEVPGVNHFTAVTVSLTKVKA